MSANRASGYYNNSDQWRPPTPDYVDTSHYQPHPMLKFMPDTEAPPPYLVENGRRHDHIVRSFQKHNDHVGSLSPHVNHTSRPPLESTPTSIHPPNDTVFTESLVSTTPTFRRPTHGTRLPTPIAVPQTAPGMGKSFLRAWTPALQNHGITPMEFLAFIDNLNVVSTANPPLQVLNMAGGFIGMVPHHWAQLASTIVQGTAQLGTAALSKGRTELYLRSTNTELLNPRGLKVSIATTSAVRAILKIPHEVPLLAPLTPQTMELNTVERALVGMRSWNAVLDVNVPPPAEQTTVLGKLSAKQVAKQTEKNDEKVFKARKKDVEKEQKNEQREIRKMEKRESKKEEKQMKRERKHKKGKDRSSSSSPSSDSELDEQRHDKQRVKRAKKDKEEKKAEKLLWILIDDI